MPTTAVVSEDAATIVSDDGDAPRGRFSWSAAFAGAFTATAVTLFLLTLGSGVGLSLVSIRGATPAGTTTFLTLGAIYFLAAQAFGFAVGGHLAGRLIGPAVETSQEEEFRAGAHGLVVWALAVVASAALVAASAFVAGSAASGSALIGPLFSSNGPSSSAAAPIATAYWVDDLFRTPPNGPQAALAWRRFAQAQTGNETDASPVQQPPPSGSTAGENTDDEAPAQPPGAQTQSAPNSGSTLSNDDTTAPVAPVSGAQVSPPDTHNVASDKAEVARILTMDMRNGGRLNREDRDWIARLVSQDTARTFGAAQRRVNEIEARIHDDQVRTADTARRIASYVGLWTAFALLFGALVAVMAAISARWEDDRQSLLPSWRARGPQ